MGQIISATLLVLSTQIVVARVLLSQEMHSVTA